MSPHCTHLLRAPIRFLLLLNVVVHPARKRTLAPKITKKTSAPEKALRFSSEKQVFSAMNYTNKL